MILTPESLALKQLLGTIQENPAVDATQKDPLINQGLQDWQYIGIIILAVCVIAGFGFFSRRIEYAILFALSLSLVLIVFFLSV